MDEHEQGPRTAGKRGRKPARHVPELHLRRFLEDTAQVAAPPTADVTGGLTDWGMLGNDTHSCCGASAWIHYLMAKTGQAAVTLPDGRRLAAADPALTDWMLQQYYAYGRGQGETGDEPDEGVENASWLKFLYDQGLFGPDAGYAEVDLTDADEAKWAMIHFRGMIIGAALTDQAEAEFQNHQPWNITATEPIDPNMGHDFLWVAYDAAAGQGRVVTWGALEGVTLAFAKAEVQAHDMEGWVILTKEDAAQAGVDLSALRQEIERLGGTVAPQPAAVAEPDPTPGGDAHPRAVVAPENRLGGRVETIFERAKAEAVAIFDRAKAEAHALVIDLTGAPPAEGPADGPPPVEGS